jgi:hypothetical protein
MLDENNQFIQAIIDYQNKGKAQEVVQYVSFVFVLWSSSIVILQLGGTLLKQIFVLRNKN